MFILLIESYFEFSVFAIGSAQSLSVARTIKSSSRSSNIMDLRKFLTTFILLNVPSSFATFTGAVKSSLYILYTKSSSSSLSAVLTWGWRWSQIWACCYGRRWLRTAAVGGSPWNYLTMHNSYSLRINIFLTYKISHQACHFRHLLDEIQSIFPTRSRVFSRRDGLCWGWVMGCLIPLPPPHTPSSFVPENSIQYMINTRFDSNLNVSYNYLKVIKLLNISLHDDPYSDQIINLAIKLTLTLRKH